MERRRRIVMVIVLILAIGSFNRIKGSEDIRAVEFLSIFAMGMLSGALLTSWLRGNNENKSN